MQKKISYLDLFKEIANEQFDGHYTVMKFTTNYRVAFGTIMANDYCELREVIQGMAEGKTLEEACRSVWKKALHYIIFRSAMEVTDYAQS